MKTKNDKSNKKLFLAFSLLLMGLLGAFAQDFYYVHTKDAGVVEIDGDQIDSVKVEGDAIRFYAGNNVFYSNTLANVDSIRITEPTYPAYPDGIPHGPGIVEAEDFDTGGEGFGFHEVDEDLSTSDYRTGADAPVDLFAQGPDGWAIGHNSGIGEWTNYTIKVPVAGDYIFSFWAGNDKAVTFDLWIDGAKAATVNVPNTSWVVQHISDSPTITLTEGVHVVKVVITEGGFTFDKFEFTKKGGTAVYPDGDLLDVTGWTLSVNSLVQGNGYEAIDRNEETFWFGADLNWKIELDMQSNKAIDLISVLQYPAEIWIKTAKVSVSTDGTTWVPAGLVEYPEKYAAYYRGDLVLETPVVARYIRIERVDGFEPTPHLALISEIYVYGHPTFPEEDLLDTTGWTVNVNSLVQGTGYEAIDGNEETFWFGNDPNWKIELDTKSVKKIDIVSVLQLPTEIWIKTAKISFSIDGITWTAGENLTYPEKSAAYARRNLMLQTPVIARYVRIERVEGFEPSPNLVLMPEIYIYGHDLGLDVTGWEVNVNSLVMGTGYEAIDRNESTFWFGNDPDWKIELDMKSNKEVRSVSVLQNPAEIWIKTAKISFSTNGTTWTPGENLTYPEKSAAYARGNLVLATPVTARYVKIEKVEGFDPTPNIVLMTEIYIYGQD
jgi:hypothetical protein